MATLSKNVAAFIISEKREKTKKTNSPFHTISDQNRFISSYLTGAKAKLFPSTIADINKVLNQGADIQRVLFKVSDIGNPAKVSVTLMAYPSGFNPATIATNDSYFILEAQFLSRMVQSELDPNGILGYSQNGKTAGGIVVQLGKDNGGDYILIVSSAYESDGNLIAFDGKDGDGQGGEPAGAGVIF